MVELYKLFGSIEPRFRKILSTTAQDFPLCIDNEVVFVHMLPLEYVIRIHGKKMDKKNKSTSLVALLTGNGALLEKLNNDDFSILSFLLQSEKTE